LELSSITKPKAFHFMFAPGVDGWPNAGCPGCSLVADQIPHLAHLHARDTSFVFVSKAPLEKIKRYRRRMGWTIRRGRCF